MHQRLIMENHHPLLCTSHAVTTFNCFSWLLLASDSVFPNAPLWSFPPPATHTLPAFFILLSLSRYLRPVVSNSLIPTITQGVNPERMTLPQGSRGPDRGEGEPSPGWGEGRLGPGAVMCRQPGELRPLGAGGAGLSDPCLPGGNGMDLLQTWLPSRKKLTQLSPGKVV